MCDESDTTNLTAHFVCDSNVEVLGLFDVGSVEEEAQHLLVAS